MIYIILPVHNEENTIRKDSSDLIKWLENFPFQTKVIYIDDHSTDSTLFILRENHKIISIINNGNRGKGSALKFAFDCLPLNKNDLIIFLDGDGQIKPTNINKLIDEFIVRLDADAVIGNKRHELSMVDYSPKRKIVSKSYNFLIRKLFNIKFQDTQCGLKLFKASCLSKVMGKIRCDKFAFDLELIVALKQNGFIIYDAPVNVSNQLNSGSANLKNVIETFIDTLKIFFRYSMGYYKVDKSHNKAEINH